MVLGATARKKATHPLRESDDHLPNVRGSNMLLLLNIFEDNQHGHSLPRSSSTNGWSSCLAAAVCTVGRQHTRSRGPRTVRSTRDLLDYCRLHPNQTNVSTSN